MKPLSEEQKREWRHRHIPSRFRAAMANTTLDSQRNSHPPGKFGADAVQMGRAIAIRWLIEFVGISWNNKRQDEQRSEPKKDLGDQRIDDIGGQAGEFLFELDNPTSHFLGQLWSAASKAVSHATSGSNHAALTDESITNAVKVLKTHFQTTLYAKHLEDLDAFIHNRPM